MQRRHFIQASLRYVKSIQEVHERKKFEFVETVKLNDWSCEFLTVAFKPRESLFCSCGVSCQHGWGFTASVSRYSCFMIVWTKEYGSLRLLYRLWHNQRIWTIYAGSSGASSEGRFTACRSCGFRSPADVMIFCHAEFSVEYLIVLKCVEKDFVVYRWETASRHSAPKEKRWWTKS